MAITRVTTAATFFGSANSTVGTPSFVATAGNLIAVGIRADSPVASLADTAGNYYRRLLDLQGVTDFSLWATWDCLGHASNVVTATFQGGSALYRGIAAAQYSGMDARPLDVTTYKLGATGSTITSPTFTTSEADALILSFGQVDNTSQTWTANDGATKIISADTGDVLMAMEKIVSSIQTGTTASADCTVTANIMLLTAVFAAGGGGGGGGGGSYAFVG